MEENKVHKKEELGLRGSSIQTNQDNAERKDRRREGEGEGEREREREGERERERERERG